MQMGLSLRATDSAVYLGSDQVIDSDHPLIVELAGQLRGSGQNDVEFSAAAFSWVRDQVAHSLDAQDRRITLSASQVLTQRVGLCYAKAHLLVALLRAGRIPAGLCYQRLRSGTEFMLHGLVALHLDGGWHRVDPRGNKPGINAQFSIEKEQLAYTVDERVGEIDYPWIFRTVAPTVMTALTGATDALLLCERGLPTEPEIAGNIENTV